MKKKRNIRSEIKKLLRPNKVSEEQVELQKIEYTEHNTDVENASKAQTVNTNAVNAKEPVEPKTEDATETYTEQVEAVTEELVKAQAEESKAAGTAFEESVEIQSIDYAQLQIENHIKLSIKKSVRQSVVQDIGHDIQIQIKPEKNVSIVLKKQPYIDFSKTIMNKYGLERLNSTFSKLIFRQYQMILKKDKLNPGAHNDTLIKNYTNHYSINKSVLKLITQSIISTNIKSNKEVKVPFYILRNPQSDSRDNSDNGLGYDKDALVLLPKTSLEEEPTHRYASDEKSVNSFVHNTSNINYYDKPFNISNAKKKGIESQKSDAQIDRVNTINRIVTKPEFLLLRNQVAQKRINTINTTIQFKNSMKFFSDNLKKVATKLHYDNNQQPKLSASIPKRNLSNRTSIGSNIDTIHRSNNDRINGNIDKNIKTSIDEKSVSSTSEKSDRYSNLIEERNGNNTGSKNINNYDNTNLYTNAATNLIFNIANNGKANGSSYINIKNNIMSNRINNEVIKTTINRNSRGLINKDINIVRKIYTKYIENNNLIEQKNGDYAETKNINSYNSSNFYSEATKNLFFNTINGKANGSSYINIRNNIMSNRIDNGVINTTINRSSKGLSNGEINSESKAVKQKAGDSKLDQDSYGRSTVSKNVDNYYSTNLYTKATTNLFLNRTINEKANGSSYININNNIMSNRINSGVLNTTINRNSKGFINKNINIITGKVSDKLENAEKLYSPQLSLKASGNSNEETRARLDSPELESDLTVRERLRENANDDVNKSEIILHTPLKQKQYTPNTTRLLRSPLVQIDGEISKIIKRISNKQQQDSNEEQLTTKNIYKDKTSLVPAEVIQYRNSKEALKITGQSWIDSNLVFCKPQQKATPTIKEEYKNVIKADEQVFAKTVTSSKKQKKYEIEVEEVNQIAEKVFKIIEKRIAIQKDRRGLR